jgi:hypothetical protein
VMFRNCIHFGKCSYFKHFTKGYSTFVAHLTNSTRHDSKCNWMVGCQEAFDKVKYALTHAFVLALPIFCEPFEVNCNAFMVGIGAI